MEPVKKNKSNAAASSDVKSDTIAEMLESVHVEVLKSDYSGKIRKWIETNLKTAKKKSVFAVILCCMLTNKSLGFNLKNNKPGQIDIGEDTYKTQDVVLALKDVITGENINDKIVRKMVGKALSDADIQATMKKHSLVGVSVSSNPACAFLAAQGKEDKFKKVAYTDEFMMMLSEIRQKDAGDQTVNWIAGRYCLNMVLLCQQPKGLEQAHASLTDVFRRDPTTLSMWFNHASSRVLAQGNSATQKDAVNKLSVMLMMTGAKPSITLGAYKHWKVMVANTQNEMLQERKQKSSTTTDIEEEDDGK